MKRHCLLLFAASYFGLTSVIPADSARASTFSESVLVDAFEKSRSLVVAEIISVREDKASRCYFYKARVVRPIILGDLTEDDIYEPVELFAGASFGDALKQGSTYALFVTKDCPYHFSWAHRNDVVPVDITDEKSLDDLARAAKGTYAETSICKFRERKLAGRISLPGIPEEILSACEEFRWGLTDRAEFGKKIYESDMGSRRDLSQLESSWIKYSPPATTLSRRHILYLLGPPTLKLGRTYNWFCGKDKNAEDPKKDVGVLSVTFDEDEKATCLLYQLQERIKWTGHARERGGRRELPGPAKSVMLGFQDALRRSGWDKALSLCSTRVRKKAKEGDSAETFFKDVVPLERIISSSQFFVRGRSSRAGEVMGYLCEVPLEVPGYEYGLEWQWSVVRANTGWFIDFKPKPLEVWKKHEVMRQTREAWRNWLSMEKQKEGLQIQLVSVSKEFAVGKPMLFRLEMTNVSDETLPYRPTAYMVNDPMIVKGPDGKSMAFMGGPCQTAVGLEFIEPGETVVLVDSYDVTSQYHITNPGRYSFQFRGWVGASNTVEVDVKRGRLSPIESVVEILKPILPKGWELTRRTHTIDYPRGAQLGRSLGTHLVVDGPGKGWRSSVSINVLLDADEVLVEHQGYVGDFWGDCRWGPVCVRADNAKELWPDYREQIIKALGIQ
jgi:hypothetical protein